MIRNRRVDLALLDAWLVTQEITNTHTRYRLRLWRENPAEFQPVLPELRAYFDEAMDDARGRLRRGFEDALAPFHDPALDPAANFPRALNRTTLQGYTGETLAVLALEHWGAFGHNDWAAPAFLFRFHYVEFQHLGEINERRREGGAHEPDVVAELRPGRTGDDALAFRRNDAGMITDVVTVEAKCLVRHDSGKLKEAHEKLVAGGALPTGVRELIELLEDYDTAEARSWQESLVKLALGGYRTIQRHDGVTYAIGDRPRRRAAWLPVDAPHPNYTLNRQLEAMEFQFENLLPLVGALYRDV